MFLKSLYKVKAHGATMDILNLGIVKELPFPLCSLPEQHRIVSAIEALFARLDATNEKLDKVPGILKKFRQSVLAAACEGKLTEDWRVDNHDVNSALEHIELANKTKRLCELRRGCISTVEIPIYTEDNIPESWIEASTSYLLQKNVIFDLKDGNHGSNHPTTKDFSKTGLPFITASQVKKLKIDYENSHRVEGEALKKLKVGFSEVGDAILTHKGTVGRAAVNTEKCVLSPQTTYYRCNPIALISQYLVYYFISPKYYNQLAAVMSQTTRDFVPIKEQYNLFITLPPLPEQYEIVKRIDALFAFADSIESKVAAAREKTEKLRQSILAKAFSGELVETEAEITRREGRGYETAEVLIEKIKAGKGKKE